MYILSNNNSTLLSSATLLAERLSSDEHPIKVSTFPVSGEKLLIRWGISGYPRHEETLYNERGLIYTCGNKARFSAFLSEHDIPHVELFQGKAPERFPVVIRTQLNAGGGKGIKIAENEEEFLPFKDEYWSYFYPFKYEWGVHILRGQVRRIFKKVWKGDEPEVKYPIRNSQNGYSFSLRKLETYPRLIKFCERFSFRFPIMFGRMDIGLTVDGEFRIIEFNSAPDLTQNANTLQMYVDFFKETIL